MWVSFLNFERGHGVSLLNFEGVPGSQGPEVPCPAVLIPLLHHATIKLIVATRITNINNILTVISTRVM